MKGESQSENALATFLEGEKMYYQFKQGLDGKWYAVFASEDEACDAMFAFNDCLLCCFGGYFNAYQL